MRYLIPCSLEKWGATNDGLEAQFDPLNCYALEVASSLIDAGNQVKVVGSFIDDEVRRPVFRSKLQSGHLWFYRHGGGWVVEHPKNHAPSLPSDTYVSSHVWGGLGLPKPKPSRLRYAFHDTRLLKYLLEPDLRLPN